MGLFKKDWSNYEDASYSDPLLDESIRKTMVKSDWIISVFTPIFIKMRRKTPGFSHGDISRKVCVL